jgi:pseudaminic acid biosynthesis-associated methylase
MARHGEAGPESRRLEDLWAGDFGDAYVERNLAAGDGRGAFWSRILAEFPARSVLEVGCNVGANLRWIAGAVGTPRAYGVDVNRKALDTLRGRVPGVRALVSLARALPFRDAAFDLAFTTGVLIHQSPEALPGVMGELVRCSRRFVLCGEYFAPEPTEVPYRGQSGALFKRDFGALYQELFPGLALRRQGFLARDEGWDDVTWWVFEKP